MAAKVRWRIDRPGWYVVKHRDGRKSWTRYGDTKAAKRQAERDAREYNRKLVRGRLGLEPPPKPKPIPFGPFAEDWYSSKVELPRERALEGSVAAKTAKLRRQGIKLHLRPILGDRDVRSLDVGDVQDVWAALLAKQHPKAKRLLARRTVELALVTLRLVLSEAVARGLLAANPVDAWRAVQPRGRAAGKLAKVSPSKVLTSDEREKLLAAVATIAPHAYPFVLFLAECGVRIGEAVALEWSAVDLEAGVAHLHREKTQSETELELSARLVRALRELRAQRRRSAMREGNPEIALEGRVFTGPQGGPIHEENFRRRVWAPAVIAAVGSDRKLTPHALRHTWTALHLGAGTPLPWIREQGGWASAKMLLDLYGAFLPRDMGGHADALERLREASRKRAEAVAITDPDGPKAVQRSTE